MDETTQPKFFYSAPSGFEFVIFYFIYQRRAFPPPLDPSPFFLYDKKRDRNFPTERQGRRNAWYSPPLSQSDQSNSVCTSVSLDPGGSPKLLPLPFCRKISVPLFISNLRASLEHRSMKGKYSAASEGQQGGGTRRVANRSLKVGVHDAYYLCDFESGKDPTVAPAFACRRIFSFPASMQ